MNSKHLLVAMALLAVFVVLPAFIFLGKPSWWKDPAPAVDPEAMARMQDRLTALEKDLSELKGGMESEGKQLKRMIEGLARSAPISTSGGSGTHQGGDDAGPELTGASGRAASRPGAGLTMEAALAALLDPELDWDDKEKLWKRIREAGLTDEIIKELEKRVAANPKDPDAQTDLGNAYLEKIQEVPQGPESGKWATKADQAYDKALELDPEHWESRFMKATALSFWPPVFGKQGEAVTHYETLVAQQEKQTAHEGFAETYYFLGNMYQQMGRIDQAISTWQRGLKLFPDHKNLQQQIANAGSLRR